jgi:carboxypeptidase Taq
MHETGHALYEMGIDRSLSRLPLANGASMAVHESQSRMFENLIGRSLPFWKFTYPRLQEVFPSQFGNVPLEAFYKGINKVSPTFIRVEADEATYNLHIMLRLELEIAMMEGSLEAGDLPEAWNSRMQEYLGITPPDDALGVMQDVHWSSGLIGYFPTYALGNLVSVQLWEKMQADMPDMDEQIERGEFGNISGLAARESTPPRCEVQATGSHTACNGLENQSAAVCTLPEEQVRNSIQSINKAFSGLEKPRISMYNRIVPGVFLEMNFSTCLDC